MQFNKKGQAFFSPYGNRIKQLTAIDDDRELIERVYMATLAKPGAGGG